MSTYVYTLIVLLGAAAAAAAAGYSYPVPPPPLFDEPAYLPPPVADDVPQIIPAYPPVGTPPPPLHDEILPPLDDGVVIPAPGQYLPPTKQAPLHVLNMSCWDSQDGGGYFRALFRVGAAGRGFPVMEGTDCVVASERDVFRIELEGQRMADCGIRACGGRMCVVVRMAAVPGLRLAEDSLVTLQCVPQEAVVSQTKHLRLSAQNEQGRSSARSIPVASGGSQRRFDSTVTLLRKSNGVFDQPVQQGSAVRLGDELLLRSSVREGDGWKSGRMGSVIIRSASSQKSAVLVDEHGCRNPTMRAVCPQQPQQVTPLTVQFPFRAFLFQGAAPADDLLLSVRMSACLRPRDCYQSTACEDAPRTRAARAANATEDLVTDWESQIQFRVLPPEAKPSRTTTPWTIIPLATISILLVCAVLALFKARTKTHQ
ncbi:uncharacterized protein LOC135137047 [Zophobas morio]|uniref:uncharacterized protein LOC135137047 n=1 Tax=Zophobas morio TaxID=2755281 RepID=UPI003082840D